MATSGTIDGGSSTSYGDVIASRITWKRNSYSIEKNTSNVTVTLSYKKKDDSTTYGTGSWKLAINGTTYTGSSYIEITDSGYKTVFSKTVTINHNADGTKSFSVNASGSYIPGTSFTNTNCSGTITLDTIPRASSFDSVTSSVALGGTATIKITSKSSGFYHKATWTCGSASATQNLGQAGSTSQKSYTYTIPTGWSAQMATVTSKTASVKIQTYSDSGYNTAVGNAITKNFTVTVPNNSTYNPTVSLTTTLGNATGLGNSTYVQGKTKVTLSATGASKANATIKSYVFKRGSTALKTVTSTSTSASVSETTNTTGSVTYSVTITDSRGRTATASKTITVNAYSNPTLTINNCYRSNSSGTKDTTSGTYFYLKATFSAGSTAGGNSITSSTARFRKATDANYIDGVDITSGTGVTLGGGNIATNTAYCVDVSITDKIGTVVKKTVTIPTIFVTMDFKAGGTGVAIGKIAESDSLFDVAMNMRITNGDDARIDLLASGYKTRGLVYSGGGDFGLRERNNDVTTWLLRFNQNCHAYMPLSLCLGDEGNNLTHDYYLRNTKRTIAFSLNMDGSCGMYHTGTGWILKADTNNNVTIPSGTFKAPKSIVRGNIHIDPTAANTPTGVPVQWSLGGVPTLSVTPYTGVPGTQVTGVGFSAVSATGATIVATRTNTSGFTVHYLAIYY